MFLQRALAIGVIVVSALAGRGEESRVASVQASESGSISEAKKTFESLKDAKNTSSQPAPNTLSVLSVPELNLGPGDAKPARGALKTAPKKSKNWLVDGVLGGARARTESLGPTRTDSGTKDPTAVDPDAPNHEMETAEIGRGRDGDLGSAKLSNSAPNTERRPLSQNPATNPLGGFMQSWISPQDRQLLLPGEPGGGASGPAATFESKSVLPVTGSSYNAETSRIPGPKISVGDNPYIASEPLVSAPRLGQFQAPAPSLPSEIILRPAASPLQIPGEAARSAPNKPVAREFGKQDDNGKYFRQLNRF